MYMCECEFLLLSHYISHFLIFFSKGNLMLIQQGKNIQPLPWGCFFPSYLWKKKSQTLISRFANTNHNLHVISPKIVFLKKEFKHFLKKCQNIIWGSVIKHGRAEFFFPQLSSLSFYDFQILPRLTLIGKQW